jgi:hypothetical protein
MRGLAGKIQMAQVALLVSAIMDEQYCNQLNYL